MGIEDSYAEPAVIPELDSKRSGNASKLPGVHSGVMSSRQLIAASILFTRSSRTSTVIGIEKEGTGIAAGTLDWRGCSILLRQEDSGGRAVGFGDDPDFRAVLETVGRQEPAIVFQGSFVFTAVLFVQLAPVASLVAADEFLRCVAGCGKRLQCAGVATT